MPVESLRPPSRLRALYAFIGFGTIVVGLAVHWYGRGLGVTARDVLGDALWAMMIWWWIAMLIPGVSFPARIGITVAICFVVEFSQLSRNPSLDALRQTTMGQLVLGSGFDPRDLASYSLGVFSAALVERVAIRRRSAAVAGMP